MNANNEIVLTGINGANPLGFLAAIGAFVTINRVCPARLSWRQYCGMWAPCIKGEAESFSSEKKLIETLHDCLCQPHPIFAIGKNATLPAMKFREHEVWAQKDWLDGSDASLSEFIVSLGSSASVDENGWTEDTAFRFVRVFKNETDKNGRPEKKPGFLDMVRTLVKNTTCENLREALFGPWKYQDDEFSLRWAPEDDRRYAFRWDDPAKDKATIVRGANRLAIEGLPLFPTMPSSSQLATTGFVGKNSSNTFWTWPIWDVPIGIDVCRSMLASSELVNPNLELAALLPSGVVAVFRCQRINPNDGKFRNFTPAVPVGA